MKTISFALFLMIINLNLFSFEMWNGLTTEMSRNELLNRLRNILQATSTLEISGNLTVFHGDMYNLNREFSSIRLSGVRFITQLPAYYPEPRRYIDIYFYEDQFFSISVPFAADLEIILNGAIQHYGNDFQVIPDRIGSQRRLINVHRWETNDRIIFLHGWPNNLISEPRVLTAINRKIIDDFNIRQARQLEQRRIEQERERTEANSGVQF